MNKKIEEKLKKATGVNIHGGKLRIHFKLPGNLRYTKKSTGLTVTENNIELAKNRLATINLDIASNLFDIDPNFFWRKHFPTDNKYASERTTLSDYFNSYESIRENDLSISRLSSIGTAKRWVEKHGLLKYDIKKITHIEIELLRNRALTTLKLSTVRGYLVIMRQVLDEAVKEDRITVNPFIKVRKIKQETDPSEDDVVNPFTQNELRRLLSVVHSQKSKDLIEFMAWSGLRPGEIKALAWEDLDLEKGILHVRYNINKKGQLKPPKTTASIRKVELMPVALEALKRQREHSYMLPLINETVHFKHKKTKQVERRRIFLGLGNKPYVKPQLITIGWSDWLRKAKLPYRPTYQLRHTFASQMLMAGAEPIWLAKQLGHKDWGMIRKIYGKWIAEERPDHRGEIARKLGQSDPYTSQETNTNN